MMNVDPGAMAVIVPPVAPAAASMVATSASQVSKDSVVWAPVTVISSVVPNSMISGACAQVRGCSALSILKVFSAVPPYSPMPLTVTFAVPAFLLLE